MHVTEPFGSSDHNIVEFTMVCRTEYTDWKNDYCDYRNGAYVGIKEYLRHIDLRSKLSRANCSTEEAWTILKASIEEAVSKFVPKKVKRKRSNKPLWWNKEIYRVRPLWWNKEIYRARPLWWNKEIYRARPLWWNKEIYRARRKRSNKPLWWNKEIYRVRPLWWNKEIYRVRPLWWNKEIYRARPLWWNKEIYRARPLWWNKEIYRARRKRSNKPLWWNKEIYRARTLRWNKEIYRARKNRLRWWNRYKQTKIHQDYRQFKRAECKASRLVRQAKRKLEEKIADNMKQDPKFFYKYARSQLKVKETVTPIEDEQGNIVINDNLKTTTTFNNHFVTQFSQENLHRIPNQVKMFQGSSKEELNSITFEESSICNKLKKLNASKSPGTDKIFPIVLNRCAEELAGPLNALFTKN